MGKTYNKVKGQKITKSQFLKMERQVRRESDIENGVKPFSTKVHKSAKAYDRKEGKRVDF